MDNPENDLEKMIESEEEITLIEYLLLQLRCEEGETNILKKNDISDMVEKRSLQYEKRELNELLDILFNQQSEDSQWEVYQRLVAMISNQEDEEEGQGEEGEGEGEEEYRNEEGEEGNEEEYQQYQMDQQQRIGEEDQYQQEEGKKIDTNYNESKENYIENKEEQMKTEENDNKGEQYNLEQEKEREQEKDKDQYQFRQYQSNEKDELNFKMKDQQAQREDKDQENEYMKQNKNNQQQENINRNYYEEQDHQKKNEKKEEVNEGNKYNNLFDNNEEHNNNNNNNINTKPQMIYKKEIDIQKGTNGIDHQKRQFNEERYQTRKNNPNALSDLDLLSNEYTLKKKEPKLISAYQPNINQLDRIDDQTYQNQQDYSYIPQRKSPYQSRLSPMKFDSVIQPINIFNNFTAFNPKQTFPSKKDNQKHNQLRSVNITKNANTLLYPINQRKLYQQPPSFSTTTKYSNMNPREIINKNRTFTTAKDQDYFYSLFQNIASNKKNMKILSDKILNVSSSSKPYARKEFKDHFVVNKYKPVIQSYHNDYKAFTNDYNAKMNPMKQRQTFNYDEYGYAPSKSYLSQINLNYNYNYNNVNDLSNQMPYSFKSKNYNLKDPKEKQMYIETLKKDLKEFTYQKEQIKKTRDDAFGMIDNQLELLMKKPNLRSVDERADGDQDGHQQYQEQKKEGISDDQVNQGYLNEQEMDHNNNNDQN